jgi:endogenous inhibitor of DNA gyrase (YacG/DUF329 family)
MEKTIRCPTCGRQFEPEPAQATMPFCGQACRMIDLGRWLNEEIGLPHHAADDEDADEEETPQPIVREWRFD